MPTLRAMLPSLDDFRRDCPRLARGGSGTILNGVLRLVPFIAAVCLAAEQATAWWILSVVTLVLVLLLLLPFLALQLNGKWSWAALITAGGGWICGGLSAGFAYAASDPDSTWETYAAACCALGSLAAWLVAEILTMIAWYGRSLEKQKWLYLLKIAYNILKLAAIICLGVAAGFSLGGESDVMRGCLYGGGTVGIVACVLLMIVGALKLLWSWLSDVFGLGDGPVEIGKIY